MPLVYGRRQEVALTSVHAALHHVTKVMKHPCSYELAFALTDYKLQGMTLQQLAVVIGAHQHPLRHTLSSLYVLLSRPQSSDGLRILEGECGAVEGLAGASMMQREELVVFERCYDRRRDSAPLTGTMASMRLASLASPASLGMKSGVQPCIRWGRKLGWLAAGEPSSL